MKNLPIGKWLLTVVGLLTVGGAYYADWNQTHMFNPRWPPHAKFHNAQTMLLGTGLGALCLWFLWGQRGHPRAALKLAVVFGGLYWLTQAGALLFPGTALTDPEFYQPQPRQLYLDAVLGLLLALGYALESRRLRRLAAGSSSLSIALFLLLMSTSLSASPAPLPPLAPLPKGFTEATAEVNGVQIHYVTGGTGEPLVLLHGWPQTWYAWHRLLPALAAHYTVIAPDLRGAGASSKPEPAAGYDAYTLAEDVHQLVQQLGRPSIRLVGHDLGVMVAYAYAATHPTEVVRLGLLDGPLPGVGPAAPPRPGIWHPGFHATPELPELLTAGRERAYLTYFFTTFAHRKTAFTPAEVDEFVRAYSAPGAMRAGFEQYRAFPVTAARNQASAQVKLPMPVLALGGQYSAGPAIVATVQQVADHVRGGSVPEAGHWLAEENPDYLLAQLLAFLP